MLSRTARVSTYRLTTVTVSQRSIAFDYLKVAKQVEAGKSLDDIEQERQLALQSKAADTFTWDWLHWFEKNHTEDFAQLSHIRNKLQTYEQFIGDRGAQAFAKQINFNDFRNKIADPSFVDELEIAYHVEKDTISSIENVNTLQSWDDKCRDSMKKECKETGDLLLMPLTDTSKAELQKSLTAAEAADEQDKDAAAQLFAEFQQADVERLMFGQETLQMKLSEHPQYAENLEDLVASKQTNLDLIMFPFQHEFVKRERLAQIQDEERRKVFLERYELSSKINNGEDASLGGAH